MDLDLRGTLPSIRGPILITGHTGFKGTWLTLVLQKLGVEVMGLSLLPQENSLYSRLNRKGVITESFIDINNYQLIVKYLAKINPSSVFHFAAQSLVLDSYENPIETFKTNVIGTANLLQAASTVDSIKNIVIATTDKVYKNEGLNVRFKESDPLEGLDPYSASKVATEAVIKSWQNISEIQKGPKIIAVRAGNVIGGGDTSRNRLIPDVVSAYQSQTTLIVRNPESTRPWQHVLDPLNGYLKSLKYLQEGGTPTNFNFGPKENSLSVRNVLEIIQKAWGIDTFLNQENPSHLPKIESKILDLDSSKANKHLSWHPKWNQTESILNTISWWDNVLNDKKTALEACQEDINKYYSH
jgi:CDP-glucose 4,6-dehydratase